MSAGALLEIDAVQNKSGYSVFLGEQVREASSGWLARAVPLHSEIPTATSEVADVLYFSAARAVRQRRNLLVRAGGALTRTEVASQLGLKARDVDRLRQTDRLIAVPDSNETWLYPACQFEGNQIVPGLDRVIPEFAVKSAWTRLYMLTSNDPALSGTSPIEALKHGDLEAVRRLVRGYGQQGAA